MFKRTLGKAHTVYKMFTSSPLYLPQPPDVLTTTVGQMYSHAVSTKQLPSLVVVDGGAAFTNALSIDTEITAAELAVSTSKSSQDTIELLRQYQTLQPVLDQLTTSAISESMLRMADEANGLQPLSHKDYQCALTNGCCPMYQ